MIRNVLLVCLALACTPAPLATDGSSSSSSTSTTTTTTTTDTSLTSSGTGAAPSADVKLPTSVFDAADIDGDGHLDLAVAATDAAVWVLQGRGDGSFEEPRRLGDLLSEPVHALATGDLDGDGLTDVAVLWGHYLALVRGGLPQETLHFRAKGPALALRDVDGDGCDDAFIAGGNELLRLRGAPTGYLEREAPLALGGEPVGVAVADLDADGALDLVTVNAGSDDLSILRGDGSGGFHPQTLLRAGSSPSAVAIADLDGDGVLDLVTLERHGLLSFRGLGGGEFAAPLGAAAPGSSRPQDRLVVCERDGDGSREIVVSHHGDGRGWLAQFEVDADARATDATVLHDRAVHGVVCADFDGDGRDDLVFTDVKLRLHVVLTSS